MFKMCEQQRKKYGLLAVYGVVFLILFYLLPPAGDDFFFHTPKTFSDFMATQKHIYLTENGRILGNACAYFFAENPILAVLFKTFVVVGIVNLINKVIGNSLNGIWALIMLLCLAIPTGIFAQTYAWSAGFYNYVTPALILLFSFKKCIEVFKEQKQGIKNSIMLFGVGFIGCLFIEYYTTYSLVFGFCVLGMYWLNKKKISVTLLAYNFGTILGTITMFLSPVYHKISENEDAYRTMSLSISQILNQARENYEMVSNFTIGRNYIIVIILSILGLGLMHKTKTTISYLSRLIVVGAPIYYYLSTKLLAINFSISSSILALCIDLCVGISYFIAMSYAINVGISSIEIKVRCYILLGSILVLNGPLLIVTPIGARCFYISYIVLVVLIGQIAKSILGNSAILKQEGIVIWFLLLTGVFVYLFIGFHQYKVYNQKCEFIEKQMEEKKEMIDVPQFEYPDYIHEPETFKIGYKYYYNEPWDIEWNYIPYKEWCALYNISD